MRPFSEHDESPDSRRVRRSFPVSPEPVIEVPVSEESQGSLQIGHILRRYWMVGLFLIILGAGVGFVSIVLTSPVYKARLIIEIKNDDSLLKSTLGVASSMDATDLNIQTIIQLLRGGFFLRRGAERLQSETVPLAPITNDIFSRIRQRIRPSTKDPLETAREGLEVAVETFDARPITRTRLIELSCDSTSPEVASQFLNSIASEFIEDNIRSRMQTSQKTSEWLSAQIEETKSKLQEAEERQQEFIQKSGNLFVGQGQENTLADSKLSQLRLDLSRIQTERIAKQMKYELTVKYPPESLPNVLDDANLRSYQQQINTLRREKAALETTLMPGNTKVKKVDAQLAVLENSFRTEVSSVVQRIRAEYEAATNQEKMLASAYAGQSQSVSAEAGKAARFNALKREVETLRQMYQSLLMQSNQSGLSVSVPITPIRVVEPSRPPNEAYKPRPVLNILFGVIAGLALTGGFAFLRERVDRRVNSPESIRRLLNIPELGVIPSGSLRSAPFANGLLGLRRGKPIEQVIALTSPDPDEAGGTLRSGASGLAESFRVTLASILRSQRHKRGSQVILVTSPGPSEGKTTVVSNLGIVLAESGRRVLLIDGDFRRPELHNRFGAPNDWGLLDLLTEGKALSEYPPDRLGISTGIPGLFLLTNRTTTKNISKSLYSPRFQNIIKTLQPRFDMILVDAPPVLYLADARVMATMTDGVILVVRSGLTNEANALEAHRRIREDGLNLLGTILNDWKPSKSEQKRHYYYDYADPDRNQ